MASGLTANEYEGGRRSPLESYLLVLVLRDMRTRFSGTLWGYGVVVRWPCVHSLALIAISTLPSTYPLWPGTARHFSSRLVSCQY